MDTKQKLRIGRIYNKYMVRVHYSNSFYDDTTDISDSDLGLIL